ncbi:hypothetical protein V6N13_036052 [Hibiscus sabdariffa]
MDLFVSNKVVAFLKFLTELIEFYFHPQKGALDTGLNISHSDKIIVRFSKDNKHVDAEIHHMYTYGGHVASCTRKKTKKKKQEKIFSTVCF